MSLTQKFLFGSSSGAYDVYFLEELTRLNHEYEFAPKDVVVGRIRAFMESNHPDLPIAILDMGHFHTRDIHCWVDGDALRLSARRIRPLTLPYDERRDLDRFDALD